jgi:hypothetical protein
MKQDDKKKVDVHFPPLFFFISFAVGVDFVSLSREGEGGGDEALSLRQR